MKDVSRRAFVPAAAAAFSFVPRRVLGGTEEQVPSDKLNIAGVGVGGMGAEYLKGCESQNVIALCDVDHVYAAKTFARYPSAKTYKDHRVMLEKEKGIDAVLIGTPDHTHAAVAMEAIRHGKAVYCAKPMTRTIQEARTVTRAAREAKVATQMSVQSCASDEACATEEWVQSGVAGPIREVHVWTDRPIWPQGLARPKEPMPVPEGLDWDLWLGPAPARPYHAIYHPFNFRGWLDFGTGALGDMALHSFHVVFRALKLPPPASVHASVTWVREPVPAERKYDSRRATFPETFPMSSMVTWDFPARGNQPPVRMHWYDGGIKPPRPRDMDPKRTMPETGLYFAGDKGTIWSGFTGGPELLSEALKSSFTPPPKTIERTIGHYEEFIAAAKGGKPANCNFEFASLIAETALLGVIAQRTGQYLEWDAANLRITNNAAANQLIGSAYRAGWSL
jgi:predicted dehydrogenase